MVFGLILLTGYERRFWLALLVSAALVGAGVFWLLLGLCQPAGSVAVGSGVLGFVGLIGNRWSIQRHGQLLRELRPSRGFYLLPAGLLIIGVVLVVFIPGDRNPVRSLGLWLASLSVPLAVGIAVRRTILDTDEVSDPLDASASPE